MKFTPLKKRLRQLCLLLGALFFVALSLPMKGRAAEFGMADVTWDDYGVTTNNGKLTQDTYKNENALLVFFIAAMDSSGEAKSEAASKLFTELASSEWIGNNDIRVYGIDASQQQLAGVRQFKDTYAPDAGFTFAMENERRFKVLTQYWKLLNPDATSIVGMKFNFCVFVEKGTVKDVWMDEQSAVGCAQHVAAAMGNSFTGGVDLTVQGTYWQTEARKGLALINEFRTGENAWYWNADNTTKTVYNQGGTQLGTLQYDVALEKIAMQRAAELALIYSHTRPSGENPYSIVIDGKTSQGENIASMQFSAEQVFVDWREDPYLYDGQGHRRNMLGESFTAVGLACFYHDGTYYWVQEFGQVSDPNLPEANDSYTAVSVPVLPGRLEACRAVIESGQREITVSFDANKGSGAPEALTKHASKPAVFPETIPVRNGYDFVGWANQVYTVSFNGQTSVTIDAGARRYFPGDLLTLNSKPTYYADWKLKEYTISYDANGGDGAPEAQTKTHGQVLTLSSTRPTREGYIFKGWAASPTATAAAYQPGGIYYANEPATLYAVWEAETYTVSFDANGGEGAPQAQTKTYGQPLSLSSTRPTRAGYTFKGWAETSTAAEAAYQPGGSYTEEKSVTLYAVWEEAPYTISFDLNGGRGDFPPITGKLGETVTLSSERPVKPWHMFEGWSETPNDNGIYYPGRSITITGDQTLYASWSKTGFHIEYDAHNYQYGDWGNPDWDSEYWPFQSENITIKSTVPTCDGYLFRGWSLVRENPVVTYQPGDPYEEEILSSSIVLYAFWEKTESFTVTYHDNGGIHGPVRPQIKTYSLPMTITSTVPRRDGYVFRGWALDPNATAADYQPGDIYTDEKSIDLYAVWEKEAPITIHFDMNGGPGSVADLTLNSGDSYTFPEEKPVWEWHYFYGWSLDPDAREDGIDFRPGQGYTFTESVTLYAVWEKIYTISIFYDCSKPYPNGWAYEVPEIIDFFDNGEEIRITSERPEHKGYVVVGWSLTRENRTIDYRPGELYTEPITGGGFDLYAVWEEKTSFTVHYDANGGEGAPADQVKTKGQPLTLSETVPTRAGYAFKGWAETASAAEAAYQPGGSYAADKDITLYAVWEKVAQPITIRFDMNGAPGSVADLTLNSGDSYTFPEEKPVWEWHYFYGWSLDPDAREDGIDFRPGQEYTFTESVTLYAVWEKVYGFSIFYDYSKPYPNGWAHEIAPEWENFEEEEEIRITSDIREHRGYVIVGWSRSYENRTIDYRPGDLYEEPITDWEIELYAVWEEKTSFTVHYDANGGEGAPADQVKTKGQPLTLSATEPTRSGYAFKGWAETASAAEAAYQPGGSYTADKDITLYAVWEQVAVPITIRFDMNGGPGSVADLTLNSGDSYTFPEEKPVWEWHYFYGWSLDPDAREDGIDFRPGQEYTFTESVTLYAVWEKVYGFSIFYDYSKPYPNGWAHEIAPEWENFEEGEEIRITSDIREHRGYVLVGWSLSNENRTIDYLPGDLYEGPITDWGIDLHAVWEEKTSFTVHYDANGGEGAPADQVKTKGQPLTLSATEPTRAGYAFKGWAETASATEAAYQPGGSYAADKDITLYAVWEKAAQPITILFDMNGGPGSVADITLNSGDSYTFPEEKPVWEWHYFYGWSLDPDAREDGIDFRPGQEYTFTESVTLYAVWEKIYYFSVSYNYSKPYPNGWAHEIAPEWENFEEGEEIRITSDIREHRGYVIVGWSRSYENRTIDYRPGDLYEEPITDWGIDLYAVWEEKTSFTVHYDANGGEGAPADQVKTKGQPLTLSETVPTRAGYAFKGWAETASAAEAAYQPGGSYAADKDITLYAVWEEKEVPKAIIHAASMTVAQQIDANIMVIVPEEAVKAVALYSNTAATATVPARQEFIFADMEKDAQGRYRLVIANIPAKEMTEVISITILDKDGNELALTQKTKAGSLAGNTFNFRVIDYVNNVLLTHSDVKYQNIGKAMLNYGQMAQIQFNHKLEDLANPEGYCQTEMAAVTANAAYDIVFPEGNSEEKTKQAIGYKSMALNLEGVTEVYLYFDHKVTAVDASGKAYKVEASGNRFRVVIENIFSNKLHEMHTVIVKEGGKNYTFKVSALSYANRMLNSASMPESLKNVCRALYLYNEAAREAFK